MMTNDLQSPAPASADGRRGALDFAEEANTSASFASQGKWDKDRANEPSSDKADHPWLWCEDEPGIEPLPGKEFTGNRWNGVHFTSAGKRAEIETRN